MTTPEQRQRLTDIITQGLVNGLGEAKAGSLCVEAAICLALGEPHSDRPSCVAGPDRDFAIGINDALWSSTEARAKALLPLALAQLGTAGTDRAQWVRRVTEGMIRQIIPIALRAAASAHDDEQHRAALEDAAVRCEREGTTGAASDAARDAADVEAAAYDAAEAAAAYAAKAAKAAAAAATTAARVVVANAAYAVAHAADDADAAAFAAKAAKAAAAAATTAARDDVLRLAVQIALDAYAAEGRTP